MATMARVRSTRTPDRLVTRRGLVGLLGGGALLLAACGAPASPTAAPKAAEPTKPAAAAPTTAPAAPTAAPAAKPTEAAKPADPTKPAAAATTAPATAATTAPTTPAAAAPAKPADPNLKKVLWWSDKTDRATVDSVNRYLIDPFNRENKEINVEFVSLPNYATVLDTAIAAGKIGDILTHNGPAWIAPYAEAGWAADLSAYDQSLGWGKKYWPWIWEQAKYKGVPRLIPGEFEMLGLYHNRKEMEANGWKPPVTFEETLATGKAMQGKQKMAYAVGKDVGVYEWWLCYACHAWAGNYATWEALAGKRPWTDPLFVESFQKTADLWQAGLMSDKQSMSITVADARGLFARGRAMLMLEGTWTLRTIDQWAPNLQWDVMPAPVWRPEARKALAIGAGEIFFLNGKGTQRDEAAKVANALYFGDKGQILTWADKPGMPGTVMPPMFYEESDFPPTFNPIYKKQILDMVKAARDQDFGFLAWTSWPQKTEAYMYTNLPAVWLGQLSVQEFLAKTQATFEEDFKTGRVNPGPEPRK
jgi:raffinose/stachyose/melibiose transport system substrate-binding protein